MTKRLVLITALIVAVAACKSKTKQPDETRTPAATEATAHAEMGLDAIERALTGLGIDGKVLRIDLNQVRKGKAVRFERAHLTDHYLLCETNDQRPGLYAYVRANLDPKWRSDLLEPTMFPIASNGETVLLVSRHYAHALEIDSGKSALMFGGGSLEGESRPPLEIPYTPTGGAAVGNDTFYIPSLGSPGNNKTLESFSMITGTRGWGLRTSALILTTPLVGGPSTDPKLYLVTRTGHVECWDAKNYGYPPRDKRWEEFLDAGVDHELCVTEDTAAEAGSCFLVDREGVVYCLNRITGARRWTNATARSPRGAPKVFGPVCIVPMKQGLCAFDTVNVIYMLEIKGGPEDGRTRWVRAGQPATLDGVTFKLEGEVLMASGKAFRVNRNAPVERAALYQGSEVLIGDTLVKITDRGSQPLWADKSYDGIVARIGEKLIAQKGTTLVALDMWTGAPTGDSVSLPGARLIPVNTSSPNLYVVGGNAVVYAFYPR